MTPIIVKAASLVPALILMSEALWVASAAVCIYWSFQALRKTRSN